MLPTEEINEPSEQIREMASQSYSDLKHVLDTNQKEFTEIEIEEDLARVKIPNSALKLLVDILRETASGNPVTVVPVTTEITTQAAAELLGCSRPHLIKLLEDGKIPFYKIGRHRRVKYKDVLAYKSSLKKNQRLLLKELMEKDSKDGLYDL